MIVVGITGSIASGKNFVAEVFKKNGAEVFDADKEVHKIFISDESAILLIQKHFPESIINGKIDKKIIAEIAFSDKKKLKILEEIIHKKIREKYKNFLQLSNKKRVKIIVLNVPLLLERQGYKCDKVISVLGSKIQKYRFLKRSGDFSKSHEEKFYKIINNQMNNFDRKKKSDFIIFNANSKANTILQTKKIIMKLRIGGAFNQYHSARKTSLVT
jgi:dephospho-CoA kinase